MQLDAEMEKVFAGPGTRENRPDKFDVAQLVGDTDTKERDSQRFKDYDSDCKCFFVFIFQGSFFHFPSVFLHIFIHHFFGMPFCRIFFKSI